jgi:hypothetical protein
LEPSSSKAKLLISTFDKKPRLNSIGGMEMFIIIIYFVDLSMLLF